MFTRKFINEQLLLRIIIYYLFNLFLTCDIIQFQLKYLFFIDDRALSLENRQSFEKQIILFQTK